MRKLWMNGDKDETEMRNLKKKRQRMEVIDKTRMICR